MRHVPVLIAALLLGGCGAAQSAEHVRPDGDAQSAGLLPPDGDAQSAGGLPPDAAGPLPPDYVPVGVGRGAAFRPRATTAAVRVGRPVDGLRCTDATGPRYGAHVELFVDDHVVAVPAGIGVAPPLRRDRPEERILAGRCYYPAITTDPTGTVELTRGAAHSLGELFAIWGEPLSRTNLAGFRITGTKLVAYVGNGAIGVHRWPGDPAAIPLRRHTRVVLELRSHVPPHRTYVFPPGL